MSEDDVNVRIPRDMLPVVGRTTEILRRLPRYAAIRLSQSAVIRLALAVGLDQLEKEAKAEYARSIPERKPMRKRSA